MEFFSWSALGTFAGALAATLVLTEIIKVFPIICKIPTQIVSYVIAAVILMLSTVYSGDFNGANAALVFINAAMISLGANGGYDAVMRIVKGKPEE